MVEAFATYVGPLERIRRGQKIVPVFDVDWDQFVLAAHPKNGGRPRALYSWTVLYEDSPRLAKRLMLREGAQIVLSKLELVG